MRCLVLVVMFLCEALALIGYDCGARQLNVPALSLKDVGECEIPIHQPDITQQYLQLLQINEYASTHVIQCKLEVHRTIYYCGSFSHNSIVLNGKNEYIQDISKEAYELLHRYGTYSLPNTKIIKGVRPNSTVTHSIVLAGSLTTEGKCSGAGYSDPYGTWESVVVQGIIKITLSDYESQIKLDNNNINLRSGKICSLSIGNCLDVDGGYTFWQVIPTDSCKFNRYGILYEGLANKMSNPDLGGNQQTVYSLSTQGVTFALTAKHYESVCGYQVITTEHPKLVIFETSKGTSFATSDMLSVTNLDIFAYVNSKFVYVEKHIREQMKNLYRGVLVQRCNLERQTIKNSLSIAKQSPDDFAFDLMKGPGYMGVSAGEVVHIVKCVPVEVKVHHGSHCYAELEVTRNNSTFFLTPRTHILKKIGTRVLCNSLLPSYYYIGNSWYKILPSPTEAMPPTVIHPLTQPTWTYINPSELAVSGIYNQKDLDQLRQRIMFPMEKPGLLNDLAREMGGYSLKKEDSSINKLMNENVIQHIMKTAW